MREKKFNKGEWECDTDEMGTWISSSEDPAPIAKMCSNLHFDQEANVNLLTASKLLLEALENVVEYLNGEGDPTTIGLTVTQAELAIAKAYGEQP